MLYLPLGTCERRAAPSALLEAVPAVQIIFFPKFYDLMLGLHLFSCRDVRSEKFVRGKNSPSSRHVCIWSSAATTTLWNSLRRDEVTRCLVWDLKWRRGEAHLVAEWEKWLWASWGQSRTRWSHLRLTWTSPTVQWTCSTPVRHPEEQEGLDTNHHCLSHLNCYEKKDLHFQIEFHSAILSPQLFPQF